MLIAGKEILITGEFIKTAHFKEEWDIDIEDPESILQEIEARNIQADIFTFRQRVPESKPKFKYYMEWDNAAALPIKSYNHWLMHQLHQNPRNKIRIAEKKGVRVEICECTDSLIENIMKIYHETPMRQGKLFPNYWISFESSKTGHRTFLDRSTFLGAYFNGELIGFLKIASTDKYARTMGILSLVSHRDKAPMNLLIAKAVEVCSDKNIPYFVYGSFKYGKRGSSTFQDFKRYLGFESIALPRYFVPLTLRGKLAIKLNLHKGIIEALPMQIVRRLLLLRDKMHEMKYAKYLKPNDK